MIVHKRITSAIVSALTSAYYRTIGAISQEQTSGTEPGQHVTKRPLRQRRSARLGETIAAGMLAYIPPPLPRKSPGRPTLAVDWPGFPLEDARFLEKNPNAFLFGVIFDRMVVANAAWSAPRRLAARLGHLDVTRLAGMKPAKLAVYLEARNGEHAIHRFTNTMAKALVAASRKLVQEYNGDARNIWDGDPGARVVIERLDDFEGISHKLAHMAARILVQNYGVVLSGWEDIDVAVDRHVARVFLRTGLVGEQANRTHFSAAELKPRIVETARALSPRFPGGLDEPAFVIGKYWCTQKRAWCTDGKEPCPLAKVCPQDRRSWGIG